MEIREHGDSRAWRFASMEIPARGDSRTRRFAAWQANVAALSAADLTGPSIEPSVAATASDHA